MKLIEYPLPKNQYIDEVQPKRIVILHHTAGGSAKSSIDWWKQTPERVATTVVIDRDGTVYRAFPYDRWASALGIKQTVFNNYGIPNINQRLDQISIQIELASWGGLTQKDGKFYNFANKEITAVTKYDKPFRGYQYYESYTKEQIAAVASLLVSFNADYGIKLDYNPEMWEVSKKALVGTWGIWSHVSYRNDKSDCHPQPELIEMLKSLKK
jgi:N-acetyl-anhydromuramyl-L-alanine amidase AmpD